jgi:hypothetical protein
MEAPWDSFLDVTYDSCTNSNVTYLPDESTANLADEDCSNLFKDPFFGLSSDEDCLRAVNPLDVHALDNLDDAQEAVDDGQNDALASFDLVDFVTNDQKVLRLPEFENLINEPRLFDEVERDPYDAQAGIAEPEINQEEDPLPNVEELTPIVSVALPEASSSTSTSVRRGRPQRVVSYSSTPDAPR